MSDRVNVESHEPWDRARQRGAIAAATLLYWTSYTTLRPLMAPYLVRLGARLPIVGLAVGVQAIPGLLMAVPLGHLTDKSGSRGPIGLGALGMALGVSVLFAFPSVLGVVVGQVLFGSGAIATWVGIQAGLVALTRGAGEAARLERVRDISRNSLFMSSGQVIGPTLGGLLTDRYGIRSAFVFVIAASLAIAAASRMLQTSSGHRADREANGRPAASEGAKGDVRSRGADFREGVANIARSRGVMIAMLASFLALFLLDIRQSFQPVYLVGVDFSATEIGVILSIGAACMFIARPLLPVLSRTLRDRTILLVVVVVGAWAIGSVVLTTNFAVVLLLSMIAGTTLGLSQPFTLALIAAYAPAERGGLGVGFRMVANRSAHLLAPIILGGLIGLIGIFAGFITVAIGVTALGLWCAWLMRGLESDTDRDRAVN